MKRIVMSLFVFFAQNLSPMGKVIVLDGVTSSGKTTIAQELHKALKWEVMDFNDSWFDTYELEQAKILGKEFKEAGDDH